MKKAHFEFEEIPFSTLARFGLTQEMIEDLPMHVLDDIYNGRHSPVLPVRVTDEHGETVESRTRFALIRMEGGQTDVVFYPALKSSPLERFDETQQKQLLEGKAIIADVETADGRHNKAFVQIDTGTKQVMYVPTPIIGRNLQVLVEELHLGATEVNGMQHGDPLMLVVDDEPVTVGIDLHSKTGIRFCSGDEQRWREQSKREWDKYTFGCYGCWVMDDDGNLDYVPEEEAGPPPTPPYEVPTAPNIQVQPKRSPFEAYELALLRYIVRYGERVLYDYVDEETNEHVIMRVADYIRFDLERDDLTFYTPAFKQMLDEAAEHCQNEGFMASRYFLAHPDPNISRLAANLISDKYQLSKYHTKFRELEQEEDKLDYLVPREIYSMKDAYILYKIKDIQAKIKEAQNKGDMEQIFDLMKQNAHLNEIKNVLCKELGERIVLKM